MLKIKCDINQQDLKRVDLPFVKSEYLSLTWSCGSRQRDTTLSGWKFRLNNISVKGLSVESIDIDDYLAQRVRTIPCLQRGTPADTGHPINVGWVIVDTHNNRNAALEDSAGAGACNKSNRCWSSQWIQPKLVPSVDPARAGPISESSQSWSP